MGDIASEAVLTGGEPTLNPSYMFNLIERLKNLNMKVEVSTNGYLLANKDYIDKLKKCCVDLVKIDLKAFSNGIHQWYTGKDNENVLKAIKLLHDQNINFLIRTIFIPEVVDFNEIERIALFIAGISRNIPYRIYQFVPSPGISRRPTRDEMIKALEIVKQYLNDVNALIDVESFRADWRHIEICSDDLYEVYRDIAEKSEKAIRGWKQRYRIVKMSEISK
ncbi:MAG: radical SAM protein [Candidatus Methanomethylicia archaeon]